MQSTVIQNIHWSKGHMISPNLIREIFFILLRVSCQVVHHYCIHNTWNSISNTFIARQKYCHRTWYIHNGWLQKCWVLNRFYHKWLNCKKRWLITQVLNMRPGGPSFQGDLRACSPGKFGNFPRRCNFLLLDI